MTVGMTALGTIARWVESVTPSTPDDDARAAVDELIPVGPGLREYVKRFCALIALSSAIASFGLLADSGAVVIGAMLVAPLMTPIMGAAAATVTADNRRLVPALSIIALGTVLAIFVGGLMSMMAGGTVIDVRALPQEIRSRTFPGLLDLGIAISAGAAAGYVLPRRSAISALPGVGIAVALVPPLATVGITAELGLPTEARNALLLYVTNLAAIVFAAGVMLLFSGFRPEVRTSRFVLAPSSRRDAGARDARRHPADTAHPVGVARPAAPECRGPLGRGLGRRRSHRRERRRCRWGRGDGRTPVGRAR